MRAHAAGFLLDESSGMYYNSGNGLCFDPKSSLYWQAAGEQRSGNKSKSDSGGTRPPRLSFSLFFLVIQRCRFNCLRNDLAPQEIPLCNVFRVGSLAPDRDPQRKSAIPRMPGNFHGAHPGPAEIYSYSYAAVQ